MHSISLQVYRSPQPPVFWAMLERFGMQDIADEWYREMVQLTPVWDFAQEVDFSHDTKLFGIDPLHFSNEGGEIILPAILKHQPDDSRIISDSGVNASILQRKALLTQWKANHPDIRDALLALPAESLKNDPHFMVGHPEYMFPVLMEPEYKGYRIIKILNHYVAVSSENPLPYNGYKLIAGTYPGMLKADNAQDMVAAINANKK
jgi:hypothetical protein